MSSPFYGLTPVYLPFSGTTDASGNLTITLKPRISFWFTGKCVVRAAAGSPVLQISDGAIPLAVGRGQRSEMAGIVAPPGASLVLDVIGAGASAAITGSLQGVQGPDMATVAQAFVMAPNTVAADISSPTILQTVAGGAGSLAAPVVQAAPRGTLAIGYSTQPNSGGFANLTAITIIGTQTGITYVSHSANFQQTPFAVPFDPADTTVTVNVTVSAPTFARPAVDILYWQAPESVFVQTIPGGAALSADITDRNARILGNLGTVPPLWQAPNFPPLRWSAALTAGVANRIVLIAGVAAQRIRLFCVTPTIDTPLAGQLIIADGDPNAGGTNIGAWSTNSAGPGPVVSAAGAPLTVANGLYLWATVGVTTYGTVVYSQG